MAEINVKVIDQEVIQVKIQEEAIRVVSIWGQGPAGAKGEQGIQGENGADGASAYDIWLSQGHTGTEADFLASIKGEKGDTGAQGIQGEKGDTGAPGTTSFAGLTDSPYWNESLAIALNGKLWTDATTADINEATNHRYVTDEQLVTLANTSGTNTGDETQATIIAKLGYTPSNQPFAGTYVLPTLTDNGNGSVTIGPGECNFFDNPTNRGTAKKYSVSGGTFSLDDNAVNYLYYSYNAGTPLLKKTLNVGDINASDNLPVYTIVRTGTTLHILNWDEGGAGMANKLSERLIKTERFKRQDGLALAETTGRILTLTNGVVWYGGTSQPLDAINTSTDNMRFFTKTEGVWSFSLVTQYNNTQYQNGANLGTLTANRYAVNWIYRGVESAKHLYCVLGTGDYTLAQAQSSQPPADVPFTITSHAILVGRVIVQKSVETATQIDSAFAVEFTPSAATDHANLINLDYSSSGHTGFVPSTRTISAWAGLEGGGDLSTNRTISLPTTGIEAGNYTNTNLTVDVYGRITAISNGTGGGADIDALSDEVLAGLRMNFANTVTNDGNGNPVEIIETGIGTLARKRKQNFTYDANELVQTQEVRILNSSDAFLYGFRKTFIYSGESIIQTDKTALTS